MECKNLINLLDEFNEHNIIATLTLKPEKIIFMYMDTKEEKNEFQDIKNYLCKKLIGISVEGIPIKKIEYDNIYSILEGYKDKDVVINISGGSKLMSIVCYQVAQEHGITSLFVDLYNEEIFKMKNGKINKLNIKFVDLNVNDFILSTGGQVICNSTDFFKDTKVKEFLKYIIANYDYWEILKRVFGDNNIITHDRFIMDTATVKLDYIPCQYKMKFKEFLLTLQQLNMIEVRYINKYMLGIRFIDLNMRTFLFKTGTWLELLVYNILNEIKEVYNVESGVVFLWNDDVRFVKNEVDVVAAANSKLVYISCKDTDKYDESTLNELEVYAQQLGGEEVKKILVATKESYKKSVIHRAEEMGINVVIFDGNTKKLKENLSNVISK